VVRSNCATCTDREGSCHVTLVPRTTRDLPPGADLEVVPRRYTTACDVTCDDSCMPREKRCLTPTLEPGAFYRVFVDGAVVMSFVEAPGSTVCASAVGG
jgi:hypothetical protein